MLAPAKNLGTLFKAGFTLFKVVFSLICNSNFELISSCLMNSFRALGMIVSHMYNTYTAVRGCVYLPNLALIRIGFSHTVN